MSSKYRVIVSDNFHYMDQDEDYPSGDYDSADEAIKKCKKIVDSFLEEAYKPGMNTKKLYESYVSFGEDPYVVAIDDAEQVNFSAWDYAKERCKQMGNMEE